MSLQTTAALESLAEIGEALNHDLPLDTMLARILGGLARLIPGDLITIALLDMTKQVITIQTSTNGLGEVITESSGRVVPIMELPTVQTIIETRDLLYLPDVSNSSLWVNSRLESGLVKAFLGAPLIVQENLLGLLFIDFYTPDPLTDDLRYTVLSFARYAATAIHNTQQRDRLARSEERYRQVASLTSDATYEWIIGESNIQWAGDIDSLLQYELGSFPRTEEAWMAIIHPNDRLRVQNAREAMIHDGARFEEEYRIQRANGTYCYVLDRALRFETLAVPHVLGAIADLTNTYELTDALVESEVRYRTLFARALDAIFVTDANGTLLDFNPAAELLTGCDYAKLVSLSLRELIPPQHLEDYWNALKLLRDRGEVSSFEMRLCKADRSIVDVEMWGTALGGGMYQLVARDVSVRKQTQVIAAQRVSELTALSDVTRATMAGGDVIEMLKRVLPGAKSALEMPMGAIYLLEPQAARLNLVAQAGFTREDTSPPDRLLLEAADNGRITPFSTLVRIVDQTANKSEPRVSLQVPLISNSNVVGLVVFSDTQMRAFHSTDIYLMDIIGRQLGIGVENVRLLDNLEQLVEQRTMDLFSTQTRYRSLIEQVPGVVYTADTVYSGLSFVSSGTETLFGLSAPEFYQGGNVLLNCVKPEDLPWLTEQANRAIATGEDFDAQYRIVNSQSLKDRWVHHRARLIMAGTGETFWLGLLTDVTNQKELEDLKNQFVATVSHELRTPLSAIKLRAATLSNYYDRLSDAQRIDMVERISYQADILADLIEDVLRLAKLDGSNIDRQVVEIELSGVGTDVVEELRPTAETAGLDFQAAWDANDCVIRADVMDLTRIWRNLISNGIKYTSHSGFVKVFTGRVTMGARRQILSSSLAADLLALPPDIAPGDWIVGVVQDNGKGISVYDQAHIFTRFFRGEAALTNIPGTGLGLSLVKELLTDYGGYIALNSIRGVGSTFTFWMPAIKNPED